MKKLFLLAATFLPAILFAQTITPDLFTLTGHFKHLDTKARAYLLYQLGANKVIDSAAIVDGSFTFTGTLLYPANAYLVIDHKGEGFAKISSSPDLLNFYLEKGIYFVEGSDSTHTAKIIGSKINDENAELNTQLKPLQAPTEKLMAEVNATSPEKRDEEAFRSAMNAKAKLIQQQQIAILKNFIITHPDSYVCITLLNQMGPHTNNPAELATLFNGLSQALKDSEPGKSLKHSIDKANVTGIGAIAPDFTQNDVNGNPVKLSSFKGKYVLVDFWASWCGPCRQENPRLVSTYNKYKGKNFTVLGVSLDRPDGKADWLKAIKTDGLVWTQVSDLNYWSNQVAVLYFIGQIPSNFLLDPTGKIVARDLRGEDLDNKLAELLGKI
jgi:peroxiredoxin